MSDENVGGLPELPEPAMHERNPYLGLAVDPYEGLRALKWYSAEQMHAYARAALSAHGQPVVDEAVIEAAWMEQCGAGWGLSWEEMLRKMFKSGTWGDQYSDGDTIYTHPEHGTELTAYMATLILATHGPFVQGYRAALGDTP